MTMRIIVHTAIWLILIGAILFLAAGDWVWPQGWFFLAELAMSSFVLSAWLARHDPALLEARTSFRVHRDQVGWDRILLPAALPIFFGWMGLIALDARRFRWSHVPLWLQALGALLILLCMIVTWRIFRVNSFAVPQVRVQAERGHRVITDGPYAVVRHPMYAGAILFFLGLPLLLGSWWGLLAVPFFVAVFGLRAVGEERMLRRALPGYDEYAERVRFRLVPGVW